MRRLRDYAYRSDLVGEHPFGDAGQLIFLAIFMLVWVLDSFIFNYSTWAAKYVSLFIRMPVVILVLIAAGYLSEEGIRIIFIEERDAPIVITKGVFRWMRHPIYLGSILFYVALLISTLSFFSALIAIVIIGFYHYLARYEEKLLLKKFGDSYTQYMRSVPMWVPRLTMRKN